MYIYGQHLAAAGTASGRLGYQRACAPAALISQHDMRAFIPQVLGDLQSVSCAAPVTTAIKPLAWPCASPPPQRRGDRLSFNAR
jgi:hypothetical protein